jgi:predicted dehydrogenase
MVAICDIDERRLDKAAARFPDAKKFTDYRVMYNEMADQIDAVTVSTPDHSHAPASVAAMKLGKHCFCQKPLTWSVKEASVVRALAAEKGVATQMGNQGTANTGLREGVEICRAGLLGEVKSVHVWTNRPIWPQGADRPANAEPIPKGLHWDLFLGPAKERPYNSAYHPFKWRGWIDYGTGALGDMACHTSNMVVMALDLFDPTTIAATSSGINTETYPKNSKIVYQFPERIRGDGEGKWSAVPMYWYDGGNLPPQELVPGVKFKGSGSMIVGSEATLYSPNDYGSQFRIYKPGTSEEIKDFKKPEPSLPRSPGHFKEFAIACSGGPAAMSNFDYAARLTGTILLGNVALRADKEITWDAEKMTTGDRETDKLLHREYREGWSL